MLAVLADVRSGLLEVAGDAWTARRGLLEAQARLLSFVRGYALGLDAGYTGGGRAPWLAAGSSAARSLICVVTTTAVAGLAEGGRGRPGPGCRWSSCPVRPNWPRRSPVTAWSASALLWTPARWPLPLVASRRYSPARARSPLTASAADDPGRFTEDFCRWQEVAEIEHLARHSRIPRIAAALMLTPQVRFYHDHVLVKEEQDEPAHPLAPGSAVLQRGRPGREHLDPGGSGARGGLHGTGPARTTGRG